MQNNTETSSDRRTEGSLERVVRALTPAFIGVTLATPISLALGDNPAGSIGMSLGMILTVGIMRWKHVL